MKKYRKLISFISLLVFSVSNYTSVFANTLLNVDNSLRSDFISKYQDLDVKVNDFEELNIENITLLPSSDKLALKTDENLGGDIKLLLSTDSNNLLHNYSVIDPYEDNKLYLPNLNIDNNIYKTSRLLFKPSENIDSLKIFINGNNAYLHNSPLIAGTQYIFKFEDADLSASTITFEAVISNNNVETPISQILPITESEVVVDPVPPVVIDTLVKSKTLSIIQASDSIDSEDIVSNLESSIKLASTEGEFDKLILNWNEKNTDIKLINSNKYGNLKVMFKNYKDSSKTAIFNSVEGSNKMSFEIPLSNDFITGNRYDYEIFFVDELGRVKSNIFNFDYPIVTNLNFTPNFGDGNENLPNLLLPNSEFSFDITSNKELNYTSVTDINDSKSNSDTIYATLEKKLDNGTSVLIPVSNPISSKDSVIGNKYTLKFNSVADITRDIGLTKLSSGDYNLKILVNSNYAEKNIAEKSYDFSIVGSYPEFQSNIDFSSLLNKDMNSVIITSSNSSSAHDSPLPNSINLNFNLPKDDSLKTLKINIIKDSKIVHSFGVEDLYLGSSSLNKIYEFENDGTYKFEIEELSTNLGYALKDVISVYDLNKLEVTSDKTNPIVTFKELSKLADGKFNTVDIDNNSTLKKDTDLAVLINDLTINENNFNSLNPKPILLTNQITKNIVPAKLEAITLTNDEETLFKVVTDSDYVIPNGNYKIETTIIDSALNKISNNLLFIVDNTSLENESIITEFLSNLSVPDSNLTKHDNKYYFNSDINLKVKLPLTTSNYSNVTVSINRVNETFIHRSLSLKSGLSNRNIDNITKNNVKGGEFIDFKIPLDTLSENNNLIDSSEFTLSIDALANNGQRISMDNINLHYDNINPIINDLKTSSKLIDGKYYSNKKSLTFGTEYSELMNLAKTKIEVSDNNGSTYTTLELINDEYKLLLSDKNIYSSKLIRISGVDLAGNPVEKSFEFYFDPGNPIITTLTPTTEKTFNSKPVFKVSKDETIKLSLKTISDNTPIVLAPKEFIINVDDKTIRDITVSVFKDDILTDTYNYPDFSSYDLDDGKYKILVVAVDKFGLTSEANFEFYIDDSAPIVSIKKFKKNTSNTYSLSDLSDLESGSYTTNTDYSLGLFIKDTTFDSSIINNYTFDYNFDIHDIKPGLVPAILKKDSNEILPIDEYLFVLDNTIISAQGIHDIKASAKDIFDQKSESNVKLIIDDSTPSLSDLTFDYINNSTTPGKPTYVAESSRVSLKDNFEVKFKLAKTLSGYESIKITLSDPEEAVNTIIEEFSWQVGVDEHLKEKEFSADFSDFISKNFKGHKLFNFKIELVNGAGTTSLKAINLHFDNISPELSLNNDGSEIKEASMFNNIPNISASLSDDTFFNGNNFTFIDKVSEFNTPNSIGFTSFEYKEFNDSPLTKVEDVKLGNTNKKGNFDILTSSNEKYIFKSGIYTVSIKAIDSANNFTEKTYNFIVDAITPEIELINIKQLVDNANTVLSADNIHYLNEDKLSITLKFNRTVTGYKDIEFLLNPDDKKGWLKKSKTTLSAKCLTHPDGGCNLEADIEHEFEISDLLAKLPKENINSLEDLNFIISPVLTSNSGLSKSSPINLNLDNVSPVLNMTTSSGDDAKGDFITNIDPIITFTDKTINLDSLTLNPNDFAANSLKITKFSVRKVNSTVFTNITPEVKLKKDALGNIKVYNQTNNTPFLFNSGDYSITIEGLDLNGNKVIKDFNFAIELKEELSNFVPKLYYKSNITTEPIDVPMSNETYYPNKSFKLKVTLPEALNGYSSLTANLKLDPKSNNSLNTTIVTGKCITHLDNCDATLGEHEFEFDITNEDILNAESTDLYLDITAVTKFNNSVNQALPIKFDNKPVKSELVIINTDNTNESISIPNANQSNVPAIGFKGSAQFKLTDPNYDFTTLSSIKKTVLLGDKTYSTSDITSDVFIKELDNNTIVLSDKLNNPYIFENGEYTVNIKTVDLNGNYLDDSYVFIVDLEEPTFNINLLKYGREGDITIPLPKYDNNYYTNKNIVVDMGLDKNLSSFKDVTLTLTDTTNNNIYDIDYKCIIHSNCDLSDLNHKFIIAIPDEIINSNNDYTKLILKVNVTSKAGITNTSNSDYNIIYDTKAPDINLINHTNNINSNISSGNIFNYNSNVSVKLNDISILNKMSSTVASNDELANNSINLKSLQKQTLETNYVDITDKISSIDTSDYSILKFLSGSSEYLLETGKYKIELSVKDLSGNISNKSFDFIVDTKGVSRKASFSYTKAYGDSNNPNDIINKYDNDLNNTFYIPHTGSLKYNLSGNVSGFNNSSMSVSYTPVNGSEITDYFASVATDLNGLSSTGVFNKDMASKSLTLNFSKPGKYVINSSASANNFGTTINDEVIVIVDHQDPSIKITPQFSDLRNLDGKTYTKDANRNFKLNVVDNYAKEISNLTINSSSLTADLGYEIDSEIQADGNYDISVTTTDMSGRTGSDKLSLVVDTIKPTVIASNSFNNVEGKNFTNQVRSYNYSVSDINKDKDTLLVNGTVFNSSSALSGDGEKTVVVSAEDKAGNVTTLAAVEFILDTVAPKISYKDVVIDKHYNVDVTPKFEATDEYLDKSTFLVTLNNNPYSKEAIVKDGSYSLVANARDYAGNASTILIPFIVDKTAPLITIEGIIEEKINAGSVKPIIKVDDSTATVTALLNGDEYFGQTIIGSSKYTLLVSAVDKAGNLSRKAVTFMLDSELPIITVDDLADGDNIRPGFKPKVSATKNAQITMLLNGQPYNGKAINDVGDYTLQIFAKDSIGNENETTIKFSVSNESLATNNSSILPSLPNNKIIIIGISLLLILILCAYITYRYYKKKFKENNNDNLD